MVTELSKWKNLKEDNVYFQPEDNRENKNSQKKKYEKITGLNTSWKWLVFLIFYAY